MNDFPIRLKPDDRPAPADPQAVAIEHMTGLSALAEEARNLVTLLTRWGDDPTAVFRRAQARAMELSEQAARAEETGQVLVQSCRFARVFSAPYPDDQGAR